MPPPDQLRTYLEFQPVIPLDQWWHVVLLAGVILGLFSFAIWMIRRDSRALPPSLRWLLFGLRSAVLVFLIVYLAGPGQRSETEIQSPSKLAVLVDTSLSMGLRDSAEPGQPERRRVDDVIDWLQRDQELDRLRKQHTLAVYRFAESGQPEMIVELPKQTQNTSLPAASLANAASQEISIWGIIAWVAAAACVVFLATTFAALFRTAGESFRHAKWLSLAIASLWLCLIAVGLADLQYAQASVWNALGFPEKSGANLAPIKAQRSTPETEKPSAPPDTDWTSELKLEGTETALGSAIQFLVNKERGSSLAGVLVFSDGQSNRGISLAAASSNARNANIPIFSVGLGKRERPANVVLADVIAPPRVLPNDRFKLKAIVKSMGLANRNVGIQVISTDETGTDERLETDDVLVLSEDSEPVTFETELESLEQGKRIYTVKVGVIEGELDDRDNNRSITIEAIQKKNQVLLMAGGPNREFRFLRNQLFRDDDVTLHVLLQSAKNGADQESDKLLSEFPGFEQEMFAYDCLIAFDPDWRRLSVNQAELLERWIAEKSGGMIVVAGPVNMPEWTRRPRGDEAIDPIRQLYPVSFFSQGTAQLKLGRFGGTQAFPLAFTREGRAARYLWLGDSSLDSIATWNQFEGVFGYYAVNEAKPGADVLAEFADPSTSIDQRLPIYLASQFYGSGRVFFQASSEMWRVRRIEVDYFVDYYNQLIRWVSQGRLLRDSNRGILLADRDRCWLGDQVSVRAILRDVNDEPLVAKSIPATVLRPDGSRKMLALQASGSQSRPGTFEALINTPVVGQYRVTVAIPGSPELEVLSTSIDASIPDLEIVNPERNDAGLAELAAKSQGHYYAGVASIPQEASNPLSLQNLVSPRDQTSRLTGTLDRFFQTKVMAWLLVWIVASLSMEWTVRRLHRLS